MEFGILKTNKCLSLKYLSLSFSISFGSKECILGECSFFPSAHNKAPPPPQNNVTSIFWLTHLKCRAERKKMYKINLHCKLLSIAAIYLQSQVVALMMNISSPFLLHIFTVQSSDHWDTY